MLKTLSFVLIALSAAACSKSKSTQASTDDDGWADNEQLDNPVYHNITTGLDEAVFRLEAFRVPLYGDELALQKLSLTATPAEFASDWTAPVWAAEGAFPCYGDCDAGSLSPQAYVSFTLDPNRDNAPIEQIKTALKTACVLGQVFGDELLLPAAAAEKEVAFDETLRDKVLNTCGEGFDDVDFVAKVGVEDLAGSVYDRKISLTLPGQAAQSIWMRNSETVLNLAYLSGDATSGIERAQMSLDKVSTLFRFEALRLDPTSNAQGVLRLVRGLSNENDSEVRFLSVLGSRSLTDASVLSLSGNVNQNTFGVSLSRKNATLDFSDRFVCAQAQDGAFVNATGCVEQTNTPRKQSFSLSSGMLTAFAAQTPDAFGLNKDLALAAFDATTLTTLAPAGK